MDIKQHLKDQIKTLKTDLAAHEKALAALEGTKQLPKVKPSTGTAVKSPAATAASSASPASPGQLPEKIIAHLAKADVDQGLSADAIATHLVAPIGQVRTTCSRLVKTGRLVAKKIGSGTFYNVVKRDTVPPPADDSPFADAAEAIN